MRFSYKGKGISLGEAFNLVPSSFEAQRGRRWQYQLVASGVIFVLFWAIFAIESPLTFRVQNTVRYYLVDSKGDWMPAIQQAVGTSIWLDSFNRQVFNSQQEFPVDRKILMTVPVSGTCFREFGWVESTKDGQRQFHSGLDILATEGMSVRAAWDGVVKRVHQNQELGRIIELEHKMGLITLYVNCKEVLVEEGQRVKQGEIIGKVGNPPNREQNNMLHFEVREYGKPVNPALYFQLPGKI